MTSVLDMISSSIEETQGRNIESEDPFEKVMIESSELIFDVADILQEGAVIETALMTAGLTMESEIEVEVDPRSGKMSVDVDFLTRIKVAIKKFFKGIADFIVGIFKSIYDFFHEKYIQKQVEFIKKYRYILEDFFKHRLDTLQTQVIQVNAPEMVKGLSIDLLISDVQFLKVNFDPLIENIKIMCDRMETSDVSKDEQLRLTPLRIFGMKVGAKSDPLGPWDDQVEMIRTEFKATLCPGMNAALISDADIKKNIKARYFGDKYKKVKQDVKGILTSMDLVDKFIDPKLFEEFKRLNKDSTRTVKESNARITTLVDKMQRVQAQNANKQATYMTLASRFKSYRSLLSLFVYAISTYWELFVVSRNMVIASAVKVIKYYRKSHSDDSIYDGD